MNRRSLTAWILVCVLALVALLPMGNAVAAETDQSAMALVAQNDGTVNMHRLYNPFTGEHFYTHDLDERDELVSYGWIYENIGWVAPEVSKTPVYRLFNPYTSDHHYTTSSGERSTMVSAGWVDEGVGWYSDDNEAVALYREFNPYETIGTHNYTTSKEEHDALVSIGWLGEGIAWYALNPDAPAMPTPQGESLIYLDAGHGKSGSSGYDVGAQGSGYSEDEETKNLTRKIAKIAQEEYGVNLYLNIDCDRPYTQRQAHAAEVGATALVSIHFNWADSASATGFESYIFEPYDQYKGAAAPGSDVMQDIMHSQLASVLNLTDRGQKTDAFSVTNGAKTGIPATLLEICFLSNPHDMSTYKATEDAVARALAYGLKLIVDAGF